MPKVTKLVDVSMETMKNTSTPILAIVARMAVTELEGRIGGAEGETLSSLVRGHITALEHLVPQRRKRT
jgi:hypothetical protein